MGSEKNILPWYVTIHETQFTALGKYYSGKISAQPHTTLCIQFLNRENNDKNNTLPLENRFFFYNSMGLYRNFTIILSWWVYWWRKITHIKTRITDLL